MKAIGGAKLGLREQPDPTPTPSTGGGQQQQSRKVCRLFNSNPWCRHSHVCSSCGEAHTVLECPQRGSQPGKLPFSSKLTPGGGGGGGGAVDHGAVASQTVGDRDLMGCCCVGYRGRAR